MIRRTGKLGLVAVLVLAAATAAAADSPKDRASWWVDTYGILDPRLNPAAARATAIFDRVVTASDKRGSRYPRLLLLRRSQGPLAFAIADGSVILSEQGLRLCIDGVDKAAGDARLAFVFGHELAHLARDDFWHAFAAAALATSEMPAETRRGLMPAVTEDANLRRGHELQADSQAMVAVALSGFDVRAVTESSDFLRSWLDKREKTTSQTSPRYPSPEERYALLRSELGRVAEAADFFAFGSRLVQLGRYEDGILLLERSREAYPGREAFANLGAAHLELGMRALAGCDEAAVVRFRLPVVVDPDTIVRKLRMRAFATGASCPAFGTYEGEMKAAVRNLEKAVEMAPDYAPGRINLASALILASEPSRALGLAEAVLGLEPGNSDAAVVRAVALYAYGVSANIDLVAPALEGLDKVLEADAENPFALYNRARIPFERGRAGARALWRRYLKRESSGIHAAAAKQALGMTQTTAAPSQPRRAGPPSPVRLGAIEPPTRGQLQPFTRKAFDLGGLQGAFYLKDPLSVLEIDGTVELVVQQEASGSLPKLGTPLRTVSRPAGRLIMYPGFALEVSDTGPRSLLFFKES